MKIKKLLVGLVLLGAVGGAFAEASSSMRELSITQPSMGMPENSQIFVYGLKGDAKLNRVEYDNYGAMKLVIVGSETSFAPEDCEDLLIVANKAGERFATGSVSTADLDWCIDDKAASSTGELQSSNSSDVIRVHWQEEASAAQSS